jgi:hypothetical protein
MDTNTRIENIRTLIANTTNPEDKATLIDILSALGDLLDGQKSWDLPDMIGASKSRCDEIFEIGSACLHVTLSR